jgi:hypothetical protein
VCSLYYRKTMKILFCIPVWLKIKYVGFLPEYLYIYNNPNYYICENNSHMTITEFLSEQEPERKKLLSSLHELILKTNPKVIAEVAPMMGNETIQYKFNNNFVYGLASPKAHMSLHAMPIYISKPIHEKYSKLLKKAKLQKGCVNFKNADEMPLDIAKQLLTECANIDWLAEYKKKKA